MLRSEDSGCFKAALGLYSCIDSTEVNCTCLDHVLSDYVTVSFQDTRKLESKDIHNYWFVVVFAKVSISIVHT